MSQENQPLPAHKVIITVLTVEDEAATKLLEAYARKSKSGELPKFKEIQQLGDELRSLGRSAHTAVAILGSMIIPETEKRWMAQRLRGMKHLEQHLEQTPGLLVRYQAFLETLDPTPPPRLRA